MTNVLKQSRFFNQFCANRCWSIRENSNTNSNSLRVKIIYSPDWRMKIKQDVVDVILRKAFSYKEDAGISIKKTYFSYVETFSLKNSSSTTTCRIMPFVSLILSYFLVLWVYFYSCSDYNLNNHNLNDHALDDRNLNNRNMNIRSLRKMMMRKRRKKSRVLCCPQTSWSYSNSLNSMRCLISSFDPSSCNCFTTFLIPSLPNL